MSGIFQDVILAVRLLIQRPGFALAAIATLALGIGANATIYSLADAVLFRPLAVPDSDRIVHVFQRRAQPGTFPLSYADYFHYRHEARSVEAIAAHYPTAPLYVAAGELTESVSGAVATASYFDVLQLRPAFGRFFRADEDQVRDRDAVAVLGYGFWQRRFGGDPSVVGSTLRVNGRHFTIVGVAPRGFTGVHPRTTETAIWIPAAMFGVGYRYCDAFDRDCQIVELVARLRPGASAADAQRELDVLAAQLAATYRRAEPTTGVTVMPARGLGQGPQSTEVRQTQIFVGVVLLALLLACANIAGLMLARFSAQRRDIAVRLAIGASRGRIARQVLVESAVLAAVGGGAGLLVSVWGTDMLAALYAHDSAGRRVAFDLTLRGVVIATTLVVTALAALCAGAAPALQAGRTDLIGVLKDETASGGSHRARLRALLVSVQVAVSVVLLVGAALMIQSLRHAYQGPGFEPDRLIMLRLRPSLVDYPREASHAFQREIVRALEAVPGVTSASPSVYLSMFSAGERVTVAGPTGTHEPVEALANAVGPRYFRTIGLELVGGREFTDQDRTGAPLAAIVNDILARRLWPAGGGVGSVLMIGAHPHTVIGIVPDAQYYPTGDPPRPQVFFSYWQPHSDDAFLNDSRTFVRVEGEPARLMPAIRRAVATVDPAVPLSEDYPVKDRVAYAFQPVRMARGLLTAFAVLALVLSAVGLYGVLAYSVAQRTREIGVRMALGATRTSIAILVLRDALLATASGAVIGLAAAWSASHLLAGLLFGIESSNVMAYAAGPAVLVLVALFASAIPVRRAANLAPLDAIRTE